MSVLRYSTVLELLRDSLGDHYKVVKKRVADCGEPQIVRPGVRPSTQRPPAPPKRANHGENQEMHEVRLEA